MASFSNTLNWSISRDDTFSYCKRKYYLSYYESWGGWNSWAAPRKQLAYFLKNRQFVVTWVGDVVHKAIKYAIQNCEQNNQEYVIESLKKRLQKDFDNSKLFTRETAKPKDLWLFEHYKSTDPDVEFNVEKAELCLRNFFGSDAFQEIKIAKESNSILYLDEGDIKKMLFQMDGLPIYAIPDLCYKKQDGSYTIIDWKTGKSKEEELTMQLKLYALRLQYVDKIDLAKNEVNAYVFYLPENEMKGRNVLQEDIESIGEYARSSFSRMREMLTDIENNVPMEESCFPKTEHVNKCTSCVFHEMCYG